MIFRYSFHELGDSTRPVRGENKHCALVQGKTNQNNVTIHQFVHPSLRQPIAGNLRHHLRSFIRQLSIFLRTLIYRPKKKTCQMVM